MSRRRRGGVSALPPLFTAEDIRTAWGPAAPSAWWLHEQCRLRRIPFTKVGGSYRFTADHVAEILTIFEKRPEQQGQAAPSSRRSQPRQQSTSDTVVPLRARQPRRRPKAG